MTNAKKNSTARKASARNSAAKKSAQQPQTGAEQNSEQNSDMIAKAAYYKAEERGFMPGYEMQDWLEAEREMDESAV